MDDIGCYHDYLKIRNVVSDNGEIVFKRDKNEIRPLRQCPYPTGDQCVAYQLWLSDPVRRGSIHIVYGGSFVLMDEY